MFEIEMLKLKLCQIYDTIACWLAGQALSPFDNTTRISSPRVAVGIFFFYKQPQALEESL